MRRSSWRRSRPWAPRSDHDMIDAAPAAAPQRPTWAVEEADAQRRRDLSRARRRATGLFVVVVVAYFSLRLGVDDRSGAIGYVVAFFEAAMVGALADWFAVTALFRHPWGVPIPHTAIIPNRKEQIGRGLGDFVQQNFLNGDVLGSKLHEAGLAARLGAWLVEPDNAERVGAALGDSLGGLSDAVAGENLRAAVNDTVLQQARAPPRSLPWSGAASTWPSRVGTTGRCSTPSCAAPRASSTSNGWSCAAGSTRSRRGGCPSPSTTASSTRSTTASPCSSARSGATLTTRSEHRSTSASPVWSAGWKTTPSCWRGARRSRTRCWTIPRCPSGRRGCGTTSRRRWWPMPAIPSRRFASDCAMSWRRWAGGSRVIPGCRPSSTTSSWTPPSGPSISFGARSPR